MRPVFLPKTGLPPRSKARIVWLGFMLSGLAFIYAIFAYGLSQDHKSDPMESTQSKAVRADFAKCRELKNPASQFFCSCEVLEQQCETARNPDHGQWNTVEFWPSDQQADREVQFILFADSDILGDFVPLDTGIVFTCLKGQSEISLFLGDNVDVAIPPKIFIGETQYLGQFGSGDNSAVLGIAKTTPFFTALKRSDLVTVEFSNQEGESKELDFDTAGFAEVTKGWEPLCFSPST